MKNIIFIIVLLLTLTSCFTEVKISFDKERQLFSTCHENIKIKHLRVISTDDTGGIGYEIQLRRGKQGSNEVYLQNNNDNYFVNKPDFSLKANKEYIVTFYHNHHHVEFTILTDSIANIQEVINKYDCIQ